MAANTSPIFELTPIVKGTTIVNSDSTDKKSLVTGGTFGTRIDSIMVSSDDTSAVNLAFYINDGSTDYYIGNVNVPIGSGYTTVARVEAMSTLAPVLLFLYVPYNYVLKVNAVAAVTSGKMVTIACMGGNY